MRWLLCLVLCACQSRSSTQLLPIGSPCMGDAQCGSGRFVCAEDHVDGYCTVGCSGDRDCPGGSVCVAADALAAGACHVLCSTVKDCRASYTCDAAGKDASHDYCDTPGSRTLLRRIRSRAWR